MTCELNHRERDYVEALRRRRDWLQQRILSSPNALTFDRHEKAALDWALRKLTGIPSQEQLG